MPEVAIDEYGKVLRSNGEVRLAGKLGVGGAETQPRLSQSAAEKHLRRGIARLDSRHECRDPLRSRGRLQSVLEVNGLVIAIEFQCRGTLLLGSEARVFRAAERQLVL